MNPSDYLDICGFSGLLTAEELKVAIGAAVEKTQSSSIQLPLPNIITMRRDQYDLLQDDPDMQAMYQTEDQLYRTSLNVMEVRISTTK